MVLVCGLPVPDGVCEISENGRFFKTDISNNIL